MGDEHFDHASSKIVAEETIHASGTVKSIADNHESLRIFHDPIPELKWPSMNMQFEVIDHDLTHPLEVGDRVNFEFVQKDGKYIIIKMAK
jgi:Cu/Ag efflux protein CusF